MVALVLEQELRFVTHLGEAGRATTLYPTANLENLHETMPFLLNFVEEGSTYTQLVYDVVRLHVLWVTQRLCSVLAERVDAKLVYELPEGIKIPVHTNAKAAAKLRVNDEFEDWLGEIICAKVEDGPSDVYIPGLDYVFKQWMKYVRVLTGDVVLGPAVNTRTSNFVFHQKPLSPLPAALFDALLTDVEKIIMKIPKKILNFLPFLSVCLDNERR